ncbi:hypothetical protein NDN08_005320 [Rhodosorus marinus]|uniref:Uncharacterized protein n=1 Tax=Rhodosorus marinus TaxID=101924 RepID=A0AAV8V185_9RHOD|nr:hypothetical protein NDN08_005320 [Rhodosorus marinus]
MKYGLVVILVAGIFGLAIADVATCASFFNPLVSSLGFSRYCLALEVEGETVGIVSNSDVVKTQGPNMGETCIRFIFIVRAGVGIRRAKLGLWAGDIPNGKARFTRKRKFLDSEPTAVRVDACLDDIRTDRDCCSQQFLAPSLLVEAKVRMEDGKVRTAKLGGPATRMAGITCLPTQDFISCTSIDDENGLEFLACGLEGSCSFIGGQPEFAGINRINRDSSTIQVVFSPAALDLQPEALELTVYEGVPSPSPGSSIPAEARTVIRRQAASVGFSDSFSIAVFLVPELSTLNIAAFALERVAPNPVPLRYSVRAVEQPRQLLEFISFASAEVYANSGPLIVGQPATNSYFGPLLDYAVVGRIGSVICGYCLNSSLPPTGEWRSLQLGQPEGLNEGQFDVELARQPGRCIFDAQIGSFGSVCGPAGEEGILQFQDTVKGQVVCGCTEPTPPPP